MQNRRYLVSLAGKTIADHFVSAREANQYAEDAARLTGNPIVGYEIRGYYYAG